MREYLSDEELSQLIEQLEEQELYAPRNLKEEILNKAFPNQTEEVQPKPKSKRQKPVSLLAYRLKIVAGMAAALIMLLLIPLETDISRDADDMARRQKRMEEMERENRSKENGSFNSVLNEGMRRFDQKINSWFDLADEMQFNDLFNTN